MWRDYRRAKRATGDGRAAAVGSAARRPRPVGSTRCGDSAAAGLPWTDSVEGGRVASMALSVSRKTYYWTAAGVIVAIVAAVVTIVLSRAAGAGASVESKQDQSGTGNVQLNGNNNVLVQSAERFKSEVHGMSREQAQEAARKY